MHKVFPWSARAELLFCPLDLSRFSTSLLPSLPWLLKIVSYDGYLIENFSDMTWLLPGYLVLDWFRTLSSNFGCYRPLWTKLTNVRCLPLQTLLPYFRCFLAISDAIVHFRTISSNFEHSRLILDTNVRIRTLSSDFKSFYSIPEAIVWFRTLPYDFGKFRLFS